MKGYALEIKMIRWECKCKKHSLSGMCGNPKSHKEEAVSSSYHGSFFHGYKTAWQREKRLSLVQILAEKLP